jgi:Xaa-Pro dipeptidase
MVRLTSKGCPVLSGRRAEAGLGDSDGATGTRAWSGAVAPNSTLAKQGEWGQDSQKGRGATSNPYTRRGEAVDQAAGRFAKYGPFGYQEVFFPAKEYARRLEALRARMAEADVDVLITFSPSNIAYVCGHFSTNLHDFQCLVVAQTRAPLMVLWYFELARFHASAVGATVEAYDTGEDPVAFLTEVLRRHCGPTERLGIDEGSASVSPGVIRRLAAALPEGRTRLVRGIVEPVRLIKSALELEKLREAARLTVIGVRAAMDTLGTGVCDRDATGAALRALYGAGSQFMAVDPYVCGGWRGGAPHSTATGHVLARGDSVFIEIGANYQRYTAPIMRTAAVGEPPPAVRDVHAIANECLDALITTMRPGVAASEVAAVGHRVVARIPSDIIFHYTFGYPVGINFPPTWLEESNFLLLENNHAPLLPGMVFHLPMSLRSYGRFGVGLSETVHVTDTGVEVLTNMPRTLIVKE